MNRNKINKQTAVIITVLLLVLSTGAIYASVVDQTPNKEVAATQNGHMTEDVRQKLLESLPHSNRADITLTYDERIELCKEGYTFDQIDAALMLANDKQIKDIKGLLKNNMEEVMQFKEKLEKAPKISKEDMLDEGKLNELIAKGFSRSDINFAFHVSKKLDISIDEAIAMVKSGDPSLAERLKVKSEGVDKNEK